MDKKKEVIGKTEEAVQNFKHEKEEVMTDSPGSFIGNQAILKIPVGQGPG